MIVVIRFLACISLISVKIAESMVNSMSVTGIRPKDFAEFGNELECECGDAGKKIGAPLNLVLMFSFVLSITFGDFNLGEEKLKN